MVPVIFESEQEHLQRCFEEIQSIQRELRAIKDRGWPLIASRQSADQGRYSRRNVEYQQKMTEYKQGGKRIKGFSSYLRSTSNISKKSRRKRES